MPFPFLEWETMMKRYLVLLTFAMLFGIADAAVARPQQSGGMNYIYPDGTIAYNYGLNNTRSNYYVIPPVNQGYYGPNTYNGYGYQYQNQYPQNVPYNNNVPRYPRWYQRDYNR